MIIRGGENIFPKEIEDFLNTHNNILESQVVTLKIIFQKNKNKILLSTSQYRSVCLTNEWVKKYVRF